MQTQSPPPPPTPHTHTHTHTLQRKKFYWRLDTKCLTLYKSDTSSQYHREIALADILAVDPMVNPEVYPLNPPHVFEIVTTAMTYYVGADMTGALPKDLKPPDSVSRRSLLVNVVVVICMFLFTFLSDFTHLLSPSSPSSPSFLHFFLFVFLFSLHTVLILSFLLSLSSSPLFSSPFFFSTSPHTLSSHS